MPVWPQGCNQLLSRALARQVWPSRGKAEDELLKGRKPGFQDKDLLVFEVKLALGAFFKGAKLFPKQLEFLFDGDAHTLFLKQVIRAESSPLWSSGPIRWPKRPRGTAGAVCWRWFLPKGWRRCDLTRRPL
jgi:hypothetical protein